MSSTTGRTNPTTWGTSGAVVAAIALTVAGAVAVVTPYPSPEGSWSFYAIQSSDVIAEAGLLLALVALHGRQRTSSGRLGAAGFWSTASGTVLFIVSTLLWLIADPGGPLIDVLFYGAVVAWLAGFPLLGVATLRAGVFPQWLGWLLVGYMALFLTAFLLAEPFPATRFLIGFPWLAVAYALGAVGTSDRAVPGTVQVGA